MQRVTPARADRPLERPGKLVDLRVVDAVDRDHAQRDSLLDRLVDRRVGGALDRLDIDDRVIGRRVAWVAHIPHQYRHEGLERRAERRQHRPVPDIGLRAQVGAGLIHALAPADQQRALRGRAAAEQWVIVAEVVRVIPEISEQQGRNDERRTES